MLPHSYQHALTPWVQKLPCITNFFFRFVLYIMMSIPCFFELPCLVGAICLALGGMIYFVASLKRESWEPLMPPRERKLGGGTTVHAPTRAPPRLPSASDMELKEVKEVRSNELIQPEKSEQPERSEQPSAPRRAPPAPPNR
jgi:hypothetical protein